MAEEITVGGKTLGIIYQDKRSIVAKGEFGEIAVVEKANKGCGVMLTPLFMWTGAEYQIDIFGGNLVKLGDGKTGIRRDGRVW